MGYECIFVSVIFLCCCCYEATSKNSLGAMIAILIFISYLCVGQSGNIYCLDEDQDGYRSTTCDHFAVLDPPTNYIPMGKTRYSYDGHLDVGDLADTFDCNDNDSKVLNQRFFYFDYDNDGLGNKNFGLISSCNEVWTNTDPDDCDNFSSRTAYADCITRESNSKSREGYTPW